MTTLLLSNAGVGAEAIYTLKANDVTLSYGGVFSGESITLYILLNGSYEPIENGVLTAAGQRIRGAGIGATIKAVVSSGGGSPSINLSATMRGY